MKKMWEILVQFCDGMTWVIIGGFGHALFNPHTPTSHTMQFSSKSLPKELGNDYV